MTREVCFRGGHFCLASASNGKSKNSWNCFFLDGLQGPFNFILLYAKFTPNLSFCLIIFRSIFIKILNMQIFMKNIAYMNICVHLLKFFHDITDFYHFLPDSIYCIDDRNSKTSEYFTHYSENVKVEMSWYFLWSQKIFGEFSPTQKVWMCHLYWENVSKHIFVKNIGSFLA